MFCNVVEDHSYTIIQEWITNFNTRLESLAFWICRHTYPVHSLYLASCKKLSISKTDFDGVIASMKGQFHNAAKMLIAELEKRFPDSELMNALAIVFPWYWLQSTCDDLFSLYMKTLRSHFGVVRHINHGTKDEP